MRQPSLTSHVAQYFFATDAVQWRQCGFIIILRRYFRTFICFMQLLSGHRVYQRVLFTPTIRFFYCCVTINIYSISILVFVFKLGFRRHNWTLHKIKQLRGVFIKLVRGEIAIQVKSYKLQRKLTNKTSSDIVNIFLQFDRQKMFLFIWKVDMKKCAFQFFVCDKKET